MVKYISTVDQLAEKSTEGSRDQSLKYLLLASGIEPAVITVRGRVGITPLDASSQLPSVYQ